MAFVLPPLPYAKDALKGFLSADTLTFHHDKHLNAYVETTNKLVQGTEFEGKDLVGMEDYVYTQHYESPCGLLVLGSYRGQLCLCDWAVGKHHSQVENRLRKMLKTCFKEETTDVIETTRRQLDEYFHGERKHFDVPLLLVGSDFQKQVWAELQNVRYGSTISYGELARRINKPSAVRAVANANGANAINIMVPCHRIIGSDGTLTGYRGGIPAKRYLLGLEQKATL